MAACCGPDELAAAVLRLVCAARMAACSDLQVGSGLFRFGRPGSAGSGVMAVACSGSEESAMVVALRRRRPVLELTLMAVCFKSTSWRPVQGLDELVALAAM